MRNKAKSALALLLSVAILIPTTPTMVFAESIAEENTVVEQTTVETKGELVSTNAVSEEASQDAKNNEVAEEVKNNDEQASEEVKEEPKEETQEATTPKKSKGVLMGAAGSSTDPEPIDLTYNGLPQVLIKNIHESKFAAAEGRIGYEYKLSTSETWLWGVAGKAVMATEPGTYTVNFRKYNSVKPKSFWKWEVDYEGNVSVTIKKITPEPEVSAASGLIYTGTAVDLISTGKSNNSEQTVEYCVSTDGGSTYTSWSSSKPTANAGGTYYVKWRVSESDHYYGTSGGPFTITVSEKGTITDSDVSLDKSSFDWNILTKTYEPKVTVKVNGKTLTKGTHYNITGTTSSTVAGEFSLTVTGTGTATSGYTGTVTKTWKVGKNVNDVTMSLVTNSFKYDGTEQEAKVATLASINKSGAKATDAGDYTVTVTGDTSEGYYGSRQFSWKITARPMSDCIVLPTSIPEYDGTTKTVSVSVTLEGRTVNASNYTLSGHQAKNAGTHTLTVTANSKNFTGSTTASWAISKATASATIAKRTGLYYTGSPQDLVTESNVTPGCDVEYVCADNAGLLAAAALVESNWSTDIPQKTRAATFCVAYRIKGTGDYKDVSWNTSYIEVTINRATPTVNVTGKTGLVYNGSDQELISSGTTTGGSLVYNIDADGDAEWDNLLWTTKASDLTAKNAGTYKIGYKIIGDDNYTDVSEKTVSVTISPRNISECTVTIPNKSATGSSQNADVTVKYNGNKLTLGTDYSLSGGTSGTDAAEYTVTVTGNKNFTGTVDKSWKIVNFSAKVTGDALVYNGSQQTVSLEVTGTDDYTVTGNKETNAGSYKATVTGNSGDYAGLAIQVSWTIGKKDVTASWTGTGLGSETTPVYDGEQHKPTLTLTGIVESEKSSVVIADAVGWELESPIAAPAYAGTYTMRSYVTFKSGIDKDNYNFKDMKGSVLYYYETEMCIHHKQVEVVWSTDTLTYNGTAQAPTATLTGLIPSDEAKYGTYCKCVVSGKETNAGTGYTATADLSWFTKLLDNYTLKTGSDSTSFAIEKKDISDSTVSAKQKGTLVYNGSSQSVELLVTDTKPVDILTVNKDYTIDTTSTYSATNAGDYKVTIKGAGNYKGQISDIDWSIKKDKIVAVLSKTSFEYDKTDKSDKAKENLVVSGVVNSNLTLDTDYYIDTTESSQNCVEVSKLLEPYKLVVKGKGNYEGTVTLSWYVEPRDLEKATITLDKDSFAYDSTKHEPVITLKDTLDGTEAALSKDDYEIIGETSGKHANYEGFTWYAISIIGKGHYAGTVIKKWTIGSTDLKDCDVEMNEFTYDGDPHSASVKTVKIGGVELPNYNYSVDNTMHDDAGTYKATIKNENEWIYGTTTKYIDVKGDKEVEWKINPKDVNDNETDFEFYLDDEQVYTGEDLPNLIYTGEEIEPELKIKDTKIGDLRAGIDYDLTYENNIKENVVNEGDKAVIKITFKGNYTGYLEKEFNIVFGEKHTVTFYANIDDEEAWETKTNIPHQTTISAPKSQPSKDDFTFAGWAVANGEEVGEVFLFDNPVMCDYKLVAKWVATTDKGDVAVKEDENNDIVAKPKSDQSSYIPLTTKEEEVVQNGGSIDVRLVVKESNSTAIEESGDKAAIEEKLSKNANIGMFLDISVIKYAYDAEQKQVGEATAVSETIKPISITIVIPEGLRQAGRKYSIIRVHNGVAKVLAKDLTPNANWEITFTTDKFSTYALAYVNKKVKNPSKKETTDGTTPVKTADEAPIEKMATIFTMAVLGAWVVLRARRKETDSSSAE